MSINLIEKKLVKIFKEIFMVDSVDSQWNFFDLGISSFELSLFKEIVSKTINCELDILLFYEYPTINTLAKILNEKYINQ